MKKILLLTLSLSALTLAEVANPEINGTVIEGEGSNPARIAIKGTIAVNTVGTRYIVYASKSGNWDSNATLDMNIGTFYFGQTKEGTKFAETPPKIYVKKLNGNQTQPLDTEVVKFSLDYDEGYYGRLFFSGQAVRDVEIGVSQELLFQAEWLLPLSTWNSIVEKINQASEGRNATYIYHQGITLGSSGSYSLPKLMRLSSPKNGEAMLDLVDNPYWNFNYMSIEDRLYIESFIGSENPISNVGILVKVEGFK